MHDVADLEPFLGLPLEWVADGFAAACRIVPYASVEHVLLMASNDARECQAHYPWVAMALSRFMQDCAAPPEDHKPSEVVQLLEQIVKTAGSLDALLSTLDDVAHGAISRGNRKKARAYLRTAESFRSHLSGFDRDTERDTFERLRLGVSGLPLAATWARQTLEGQGDISGGAGSRVPGLPGLVWILSGVWASMVGRPPSAARSRDGAEPPFVRFVTEGCRAVAASPPTRAMIETALATE